MEQKLQSPITVGQTVYRAEPPSKYFYAEVEMLFDGRDGRRHAVVAHVSKINAAPCVIGYTTWDIDSLYTTQEDATEAWASAERAKLEEELRKVSA